MLNNRQVTSFN